MGFFDIFRKKPAINPAELKIDITKQAAVINGRTVNFPCNVDAFADILGKARRFEGKAGNINFVWDELGMYCYATDKLKIYAVAVRTAPSAVAAGFDPEKMFRGMLTICGAPWEEVVSGGEDIEIARVRDFEGLSLFSEYADFDYGDRYGSNHAYSSIEIRLS